MLRCALLRKHLEKKRYLEGQGYVYVGKWECEFDREVRENDTLRNCVQQSEMINPLEPRDAFYGGRLRRYVDTVSVAGFHYMFYTE
jgi:hypothetical protein